MVWLIGHRQPKGAATAMLRPTVTAPHLDSTAGRPSPPRQRTSVLSRWHRLRSPSLRIRAAWSGPSHGRTALAPPAKRTCRSTTSRANVGVAQAGSARGTVRELAGTQRCGCAAGAGASRQPQPRSTAHPRAQPRADRAARLGPGIAAARRPPRAARVRLPRAAGPGRRRGSAMGRCSSSIPTAGNGGGDASVEDWRLEARSTG